MIGRPYRYTTGWRAPKRGSRPYRPYRPYRSGLGQHYWDGRSSGILITRDGMGQHPTTGRYSAMAPRVSTPQVGPWGRRAARPPFHTPSGRPLMGVGNGNGVKPDDPNKTDGPLSFQAGLVSGPIGMLVGTGTGAALGALLGRILYQGKGTPAQTNKYERGFSVLGAFSTLAALAISNKRSTGEFFPNERTRRSYVAWGERRDAMRRQLENGEEIKPVRIKPNGDQAVPGVRAPGDTTIASHMIVDALDTFDRAVGQFHGEMDQGQIVRHQARLAEAVERAKAMVPAGVMASPDLAALTSEAQRVIVRLQNNLDADEGVM